MTAAAAESGALRPKWGSVQEIIKQDWEVQVTRAPKGVFVLIHLYQNYSQACQVLNGIWD